VSSNEEIVLLVGDNPFHGISHLSQERARIRGNELTSESAARLVLKSVENGADGFMFSVSDLTLAILRAIREEGKADRLELHAIVPYAFEYVRAAAQTGMPGLAKRLAKQIAISGDFGSIAAGLKAAMTADPAALLRTYLSYEISRIRSAAKQANLVSVLLHEVVTDMSLALNLRWLFESYVEFMLKRGIKPGFNTRNFPYLVKRFEEWDIDLGQTLIATPFNKVGFQMNPSRADCEKALKSSSELNVVAISILASGYLRPREAIEYIATLPRIEGVSVGVSKEKHALEVFRLLKQKLATCQQSQK
jgi:hypothetical protein